MSPRDREIEELFDRAVPIVTLQRWPSVTSQVRLAVARSAGRVGIPVYGIHEDRWTPAAVSRYSRGGFVHPGPVSDEEWIANLCRFGRRLERPVLVPIDDGDAFFVDRHQEALADAFRFPRQPEGLVRRTGDKRAMNALCRELGVDTPGAEFPDDVESARRLAHVLGYPVVLKQIDASVARNVPGPRVVIAPDETALGREYVQMASDLLPNVMLQEYIPGSSESVWMMNGYFGEDSECSIAFTGRKLRQYPPNRGVTTLGICSRNDAVEQATSRLAKAIGYRGIIDIGWRYDARDDTYKLLDLNPRLGATFRLFVGASGMDVLRALHLDMTGRAVPADALVEGRKWTTEINDLKSSWAQAREGELSFGEWSRSLAGVAEATWLSADDPLPAAAVVARLGGNLARRATARLS